VRRVVMICRIDVVGFKLSAVGIRVLIMGIVHAPRDPPLLGRV
jgi:hypothetical protein